MNDSVTFIGDCHGKLGEYLNLVQGLNTSSIQLGDMGLGFSEMRTGEALPRMENHRFLRGNHDDPHQCRQHSNYLGEWGYLQDLDLLFVSGARSLDKDWRVEGMSWWPEEELPYATLLDIVLMFGTLQPTIVASHEAPVDVFGELFKYRHIERSRTSAALGTALAKHAPEYWICAHHHRSARRRIGETLFVSLDELETFELPTSGND